MTANVLEHRRARAFADAVEDRPSTTGVDRSGTGPAEERFTEMVAAVQGLRATPVPVMDAAVKADQRALLMAEFERAFAGGGGAEVPKQRSRGAHRATEAARAFRPGSRWGRRLALGGLAAGVALGTFGGVAAASTSAVPGDALYGMKRGLEDWQLNLAGSNAERGKLLLDQASRRMSEAQQLTEHQHAGDPLSPHLLDEVSRALTDMNTEGSQGRDLLKAIYAQDHALAPMQQLAAFADSQQQRLAEIEPKLDGRLDPQTGRVQNLLSGISADLAPLHLAAAAPGGAGGQGGPSGTAAPSGATTSGTGTSGGQPAASGAPHAATTSGTGSSGGGSPAASPSATGNNGLLGSVGGLLGGPSAAPSASSGGNSGSTASPTPAPGGGVSIPPLIPGLLPGIGIGVSGGG